MWSFLICEFGKFARRALRIEQCVVYLFADVIVDIAIIGTIVRVPITHHTLIAELDIGHIFDYNAPKMLVIEFWQCVVNAF